MLPLRSERFRSLDVFRGASVAGMILVNNLGAREGAYPQLLHAEWNGWTFADVIFPFFLFIVGVSLTLSTDSRIAGGADRIALLSRALRRTLLLYVSGVFIDLLIFPQRNFPYFALQGHVRLSGVLQDIAVCYMAAFLIYMAAGWRGAILGIIGVNLIYLGLLYRVPVPVCGSGVLTPGCAFPVYLEGLLKSHGWNAFFDPEGLGTVFPKLASILFGVPAGVLLRTEARPRPRLLRLLGGGLGLALFGVFLASWVPINKHLWTTSYSVLMAGLAAICFAACHCVVDVWRSGGWLTPFEVFGMNAVAAYLLSYPVDHALRVHLAGRSLTDDVCELLASPSNASLLFAVLVCMVVYSVVWFMYRRRWFLKF